MSLELTKTYYLCITFLFTTNNFVKPLSFPKDFQFGAATASYQIEGGWNADGKGENIWDRLVHEHPDYAKDNKTGDIACDSYHLWKKDVEMLKQLGVAVYRFSISWTRILPSGYSNYVNSDGVRYYDNLINELLKNNIEPLVTLFHWDLPQPLQEIGGWTNSLIADHYEDYVKVIFELFGDRVKKWITFNEPASICNAGYGSSSLAPLQEAPGIGDYLCAHTLLLAHARAYHAYNKHYQRKQKGKLGMTINTSWLQPKTNSTKDIEAAERAMQFVLGLWAHPIYTKSGDYPKVVKDNINYLSKKENYSRSRLPPLTKNEIKYIRGTYDFLGLNHYSTYLVGDKKPSADDTVSFFNDVSVTIEQDPSWPSSGTGWLKVVPWGFRKMLNWVKKEYNNPTVYITENGYSDNGELNDVERINYLKKYLNALLKAIQLDNCNVQVYTVWSLIDNFEWQSGYTVKFGVYHVNFSDPKRTRTAKASAQVYQNIIKTKTIPN